MSEDLEHDMTATSWKRLASSFKGNFISIFCTLGFDQSVAKRGEKWHRQCLPWLCQPQFPLCRGEKDFSQLSVGKTFASQGESMLMAMKDVALSSGSAW